ncbi:MAG: polysaccharide deacetylase family protein [Clostridia bacterium]|nr:polysaccharide deacetylase family protein [Clostridia bacterium]
MRKICLMIIMTMLALMLSITTVFSQELETLLIKARNFQEDERGDWRIALSGTAWDGAMLEGLAKNKENAATKYIYLKKDGEYIIWAHSRDYGETKGPRYYRIFVDDKIVTHSENADNYFGDVKSENNNFVWEKSQKTELKKGWHKISFYTANMEARFDSIVITSDNLYTPPGANTTEFQGMRDLVNPVWNENPLSYTGIQPDSAVVSWTSATDNKGVCFYQIYKNNELADTVDASVHEYKLEGLELNTDYDIKIAAFDAVGNKSFTESVNVRLGSSDKYSILSAAWKKGGVEVCVRNNSDEERKAILITALYAENRMLKNISMQNIDIEINNRNVYEFDIVPKQDETVKFFVWNATKDIIPEAQVYEYSLIDSLLLKPVPDKTVVLSFDDTLKNHYTIVAPELEKRGFNATFYITEFDREEYGAANYEDGVNKGIYMSWSEIADLDDRGFEIGNHGLHHRGFINEANNFDVIKEDIEGLEERCKTYGVTLPTTFAYPGLQVTQEGKDYLKQKGYVFARTAHADAYNPLTQDPLEVKAANGTDLFNYDAFITKVSYAKNGEIPVLMYHDVNQHNKEAFIKTLDYLKDNDYLVLSLRDLTEFIDVKKALYGEVLTIPTVFGDNMVLQRDKNIKIWGETLASEEVVVTLNDVRATTTSDASGDWSCDLPPQQAGGPYTLSVTAAGETITFNNVLIGDVFVCSGQSNMAYSLSTVADAENEIKQAENYPNVRLFCQDTGGSSLPEINAKNGRWEICNSESAENFSGLGYLIGKKMYDALEEEVPVGILFAARGGTSIDYWTSAEAKKMAAEMKGSAQDVSRYNSGECFNLMLNPMLGYQAKAFVWYQGESNSVTKASESEQKETAELYEYALLSMIKDIRNKWNDQSLPFIIVQLPNYEKETYDYSYTREAQYDVCSTDNYSYIVSTLDIGDDYDIHPKNKQAFADRICLSLLQNIYGNEIISIPRLSNVSLNGSMVSLVFDNVGDGLSIVGNGGFEIAGGDGVFYPATIEISNNTVRLFNSNIDNPAFVRYAHMKIPVDYVRNSLDIPIPAFSYTLN